MMARLSSSLMKCWELRSARNEAEERVMMHAKKLVERNELIAKLEKELREDGRTEDSERSEDG